MKLRTRREFFLEAGVAFGTSAAFPRFFIETSANHSNPFIHAQNMPGSDAPDLNRELAPGDVTAQRTMRGLMVDAGRVPESMDYYRRVIEFCAEWELNTLQFRLADDQGAAMRFASAPDLLTHKDAFTPDQLKSLADYAASHGVDLIPELESFGHTGFITRSPAYAHLLDADPRGTSEFTGVIPVHPETLELFEKLYRETASIFPSVYLHGGCDEVNWGGSELSRKALEKKTRAQIWTEYLNSLHRIATSNGKQFIVWGDVVLHKEPEILDGLNKNIIIMDWNYSETSSAKIRDAYLKLRAKGFRGIGAPALIRYIWGSRAGTEQLRNIDAFADSYLGSNDPGSLGVVLTNWIPSRYIQNSLWDGFAYAAVAFQQGAATAQTSGFRRFVEKHYRASWSDTWDEAFHLIYDSAPAVEDRESSSWMGLRLTLPWSDDSQLTALLKEKAPRPNPFTRLRSLLVLLEPSILKNYSDFQAFTLCVEYLECAYWREAMVIEYSSSQPLDRETADLMIQNIAARDQALCDALLKDWDRGRPADAPAKSEPLYGFGPKDQLLFQWKRATDYSTSLASHPERFYQLLNGARAS